MTRIKDFLSIFKDAVLIVLFLLLICFPALLNGILERAGFTEGSMMGFTWKQKAQQSKEVADSSQQIALQAGFQMEQMQERLDSISKKLVTLSATTNDPAVENITQSIDASKAQLKISKMDLRKEVQFQQKKLNYIFKDGAVAVPK
jgi:preprotein translocase subunit SecF